MTFISSDPIWWPVISNTRLGNYFIVVSSTMIYPSINIQTRGALRGDTIFCMKWVLLMAAIPIQLLTALLHRQAWISVVVNAMLGVIMMARIHAMYQRSKKMLIFLVVVLLASTITSGVIMGIATIGAVGEEYVLSGYRVCVAEITSNAADLSYESLISTAIWEILVLCLAVWIVIKHFRELQQSPSGSTIGDCFMALSKKPRVLLSSYTSSAGAAAYNGIMTFAQALQMFVLGPRLILSIREYNAKIVARSDEGTCMTSIAFQAGGDALTSRDV
ncbi:hypothetical protein F4604DRAFT_1687839 [Suillus subluteus]|nr:hypothetical protein F4604DRAFT_1687839 [Suillus subluteus]